jgi:hypothetical protein
MLVDYSSVVPNLYSKVPATLRGIVGMIFLYMNNFSSEVD